jgi:hypothetical protein
MSNVAPVWPGPRLLVPMACDVLLFGLPDQQSVGNWANTQTNYQNLYMGADAGPLPFSTTNRPAPGAHLMWTLPSTLRHGIQSTTTGEMNFPLAPNRWLVMRIAYPNNASAPTLTAAVINSDVLSTFDPNLSQYPDGSGAAPSTIGQFQSLQAWTAPLNSGGDFLKALGPGNVSWSAGYDNIKNVFSFHDDLPNQAGNYAYIVAGWYSAPTSDPAYALPTDNEDDWQDALDKLDWSIGTGLNEVTDAIQAWSEFANVWGVNSGTPSSSLPEQLQNAAKAWATWRNTNGISEAQPNLAKQLICHSLIATINWQGKDIAYGTGAPGGGTKYPTIAMGNTGAEAIAAYMANLVVNTYQQQPDNIPIIEKAIEAFQLGILNQLTTDVVGTEALLQQARFNSVSGGSVWTVVSESNSDGLSSSDTQVVALTESQTESLTQLNTLQQEYNEKNRILESQRGELGAVIFKANHLDRSSPNWLTPDISAALDVMAQAVSSSALDLSDLTDKIKLQKDSLLSELDGDFILKPISESPFFQPNNPVVLVAGADIDTKWSAPGTYGGEDTLRVRVTGQTVTGLELTFTINSEEKTATLEASDIFAINQVILPLKDSGSPTSVLAGLPKEISSFILEGILLDPSSALFLATLWFQKVNHTPSQDELNKLTNDIKSMQTSLWSEPGGLNELLVQTTTGFEGIVPSAAAVSLRSAQPWTPVFVDWQVRWIPNASSTSPLSDQLEGWELSEIDYLYKDTFELDNPSNNALNFVGRSIINVEAAQTLQAQFSSFKDNPDYDDLPEYIRDDLELVADLVGGIDMVAQSLSGFSEQLTTRLMNMMQPYALASSKLPVTQEQIDLIGSGPWNFQPNTGTAPNTKPISDEGSLPFFPVRTGHIQLMKLWVVDSYGQILVGQNPQKEPDPIDMLVSQSMVTKGSGNESIAQLPPRIIQPTRTELNFVNAKNDGELTNSSALTSPICGWIMPNHLDDSLIVFDAEGINQGSIIAIEGSNNTTGLRWDQPVGSDAPLGSSPALSNSHLQGFVTSLLNFGTVSSSAYGDLLDIIDSALWANDAVGSVSTTGNLSVLLGKPLALVRAKVQFSLHGRPLYNQSWANTGQYYVGSNGNTPIYDPQQTPINQFNFNIRIGDLGFQTNGVIGYFIGNQYDTIYSAHAYTPTSGIRAGLRVHPMSGQSIPKILDMTSTPDSAYVTTNYLIEMAPDAEDLYVTLLVDPTKEIPLIMGSQPAITIGLSSSQYISALNRMEASFRVGPILTNPASIQMPLPAEIRGKWGWAARTDVTEWTTSDNVGSQNGIATLSDLPPTLSEGWLTLSPKNLGGNSN